MLVLPAHICLLVDLGPAFIGWAGTIEGTATCLVTPRACTDEAVKIQVIELLRREGIPCADADCPVGTAMRAA